MAPIGFSTGSLALANFRLGLSMVEGTPTAAVELSALREDELSPLIDALDDLDLGRFSYISFHAPSRLENLTEEFVVELLARVVEREWPIIVHPDLLQSESLWRKLGRFLCIENMDKRKTVGRTASEMAAVFARFPKASWCFDIGHARQVDPTMSEALSMLDQFRRRLRQVHLSTVDSRSKHEPLSFDAVMAYRGLANSIPMDVPVILETPVTGDAIAMELKRAAWALGRNEPTHSTQG